MKKRQLTTKDKATIKIFKINEPQYALCPWRFEIIYRGITHRYSGIPNYCETKRSAAIRASYRKRWLENGTYEQHYRPLCDYASGK